MAHSSAACSAVLGAALLAVALGRRVLPQIGAAATGIVILLALLEEGAHVRLGAERLHVTPMVPNTAVSFVLLALVVALMSLRGFARRTLALAALGSATVGLGLNSFAGYLTGFQTFEWGRFNPMAIHTAAGILVLGLGALAFSWSDDDAGIHRPGRMSVVVAMAGVMTAISIWQALLANQRVYVERAIRADVAQARNDRPRPKAGRSNGGPGGFRAWNATPDSSARYSTTYFRTPSNLPGCGPVP